jgi:hypothetical protein
MHLRLGRRHGLGAAVVMEIVGGGGGSALCAQLADAWHRQQVGVLHRLWSKCICDWGAVMVLGQWW